MRKRFEHTYTTVSVASLEPTLRDYEEAGWELASVVPTLPSAVSDTELFILFFKRPVTSRVSMQDC